MVECAVIHEDTSFDYISEFAGYSFTEMASEQQLQQQSPVALQLRLEDVCEIATRVSEEFQRLASQFGGTRFSTIVTLVLDALEQLESVVTTNQQLEIKVRKLILGNDTLMREKEETSAALKVCSSLVHVPGTRSGGQLAC